MLIKIAWKLLIYMPLKSKVKNFPNWKNILLNKMMAASDRWMMHPPYDTLLAQPVVGWMSHPPIKPSESFTKSREPYANNL